MLIGVELAQGERVMLWRAFDPGVVTVGKNPECELCVPDEAVAPVQCLLRREGAALTLVNRAPEGTVVNGELTTRELRLADGDRLTLGPVVATVRFRGQEATAGNTRTLDARRSGAPSTYTVLAPVAYPSRAWAIEKRGVSVGSDESNDIILADPYVSSFHARFTLEDGRCIVRDLGSRNGVFIGEQKVREAEVAVGASVRLGQVVLQVTGGGTAPQESAATPATHSTWVGVSEAAERVRGLCLRLAPNDAPVLVTGETGTGKEVVARMLADESPRRGEPFVALNCGALTRSLIESELFGHEKGAFTGATARKAGAFEAADGGTLFLDEIGELPLDLQPQLLRVLENHEVRRVGGSESFRVDVRLIAATNRRLEEEVAAGRFREDLFHRLHVLALHLPPLRSRREDIPELVSYFAALFSPPSQRLKVTPAAMKKLEAHTYPGNVRELRNVVQRAALMRVGAAIDADDVTFTPSTLAARVEATQATSARTLQEIERAAIVGELVRHGGNKTEAAAALGVSRSTIHRKIDELQIDVEALIASG